jgi:hypothetical protein
MGRTRLIRSVIVLFIILVEGMEEEKVVAYQFL